MPSPIVEEEIIFKKGRKVRSMRRVSRVSCIGIVWILDHGGSSGHIWPYPSDILSHFQAWLWFMLIAVDCTSSDMLRCYVLLKVSTLLPAFLLETYRCHWACHANMLTLEPRDWQAEILEHFASQEQVCEVHRASLHITSEVEMLQQQLRLELAIHGNVTYCNSITRRASVSSPSSRSSLSSGTASWRLGSILSIKPLKNKVRLFDLHAHHLIHVLFPPSVYFFSGLAYTK